MPESSNELLTFRTLYDSPMIGVRDYICRDESCKKSAEEHSDTNSVTLLRHGQKRDDSRRENRMSKPEDVMAILKLYELRRDDQMRAARQWYFSEFAPDSALDIIALYRGGERASANFRMVTSYWDTAASLVLNDGIDRKLFLDANTEHVFVYAKIEPFLKEIRGMFREPDYLMHLENLVRSLPDFEVKMESRKRLSAIWTAKAEAAG